MRYRWLAAILLAALAISLTPVAAEVVEVDPSKDAVTALDHGESLRLATLQGTAFPYLASEISPDDTTVVHFLRKPGGADFDLGFLNVADGAIRPANRTIGGLTPFSELRWSDGRTLVYVSFEPERGTVLVAV